MTPEIINSPYIKQIVALHTQFPERKLFHEKAAPILKQMAEDKEFMKHVIVRNFDDDGFLSQQWTGYNIPFLYIFENEHINIKIHLFPPHPQKREHVAAHCIHHHNNYLLTTYAFFGTGYETILFAKDFVIDAKTKEVNLKVKENFHQQQRNPHLVDAWEPHIVFIPQDLSATLVMWTPDKVRSTDNLRSNPVLKALKVPLRKVIQFLGLAQNLGISLANTHQFYANKGKFFAIEEEEYFSATKAERGPIVNEYSAKMIFAFLQRSGLFLSEYFEGKLHNSNFPEYYKPLIKFVLEGGKVEDVYHRTELNIPISTYSKTDIYGNQS